MGGWSRRGGWRAFDHVLPRRPCIFLPKIGGRDFHATRSFVYRGTARGLIASVPEAGSSNGHRIPRCSHESLRDSNQLLPDLEHSLGGSGAIGIGRRSGRGEGGGDGEVGPSGVERIRCPRGCEDARPVRDGRSEIVRFDRNSRTVRHPNSTTAVPADAGTHPLSDAAWRGVVRLDKGDPRTARSAVSDVVASSLREPGLSCRLDDFGCSRSACDRPVPL